MKYIIRFREPGQSWRTTSYTCPEPVTEEYLVSFFGLDECDEYEIEVEQNK